MTVVTVAALVAALSLQLLACVGGNVAATPADADAFASFSVETRNGAVTCNESAPNWAVVRVRIGDNSGYRGGDPAPFMRDGEGFKASTMLIIAVSGSAQQNTCFGANDACYAGQHANTLRILDMRSNARLATLASVNGSGAALRHSGAQTIPETRFTVSAGSSFGFVFATTYCSSVGASTASLYMQAWRIPTPRPTSPPTLLLSSTIFSMSTNPFPQLSCDMNNPNWVVLKPTSMGVGLQLNAASNQITLATNVKYVVVRGTAYLDSCPTYGAGSFCLMTGSNYNTLSVHATAPSKTWLMDLASASGGELGPNAGLKTVQMRSPPIAIFSQNSSSIGFVFRTSFCDNERNPAKVRSYADVVLDVYMDANEPADVFPTPSPPASGDSSAAVAAGVSVSVVVVALGVAGLLLARRSRRARARDGAGRREPDVSGGATTLRQHVGGSQRFEVPPPSRSPPSPPSPTSPSRPAPTAPPSTSTSTFVPSLATLAASTSLHTVPVAAVVGDPISESTRQIIPVASEAAVRDAGDVSKV